MTLLNSRRQLIGAALGTALLLQGALAVAKDTVKIAFIGPLTGGVAANGIGGRNSADLAVKLRNEDPKSKYKYELVSLNDECKPNVGVQVATKASADNSIIAGVTHYCSAVAMSTGDVYRRFGLPTIVWGAVLPEITYGNDFKEVHRVNGTMINQNEVAAKFMTGLGYKKWVVIHDTTDYGKGHNKYFSQFVATRFAWHRALAEPDGVGTGGTIVGPIASMAVLGDVQKAVDEVVGSLLWERESFSLEIWRGEWHQEK